MYMQQLGTRVKNGCSPSTFFSKSLSLIGLNDNILCFQSSLGMMLKFNTHAHYIKYKKEVYDQQLVISEPNSRPRNQNGK